MTLTEDDKFDDKEGGPTYDQDKGTLEFITTNNVEVKFRASTHIESLLFCPPVRRHVKSQSTNLFSPSFSD